jgi:hypothetical protein
MSGNAKHPVKERPCLPAHGAALGNEGDTAAAVMLEAELKVYR